MAFRAIVLALLTFLKFAVNDGRACSVLARTESGWVCGTNRTAKSGTPYASFRGIPYAKQPLEELRFQELQPAEPWDDVFNASTEGPACYQTDIFYGPLMQPQGHSEACIHANVHVPLHALPSPNKTEKTTGGLPIFVFYHGGAWVCGSGDTDIHGPEFIVGNDVIVITFNYRLAVLGFLSLNTPKIPGNNGLRDGITLLKWVQKNARHFGGDPDNVTLGGQSVGATNAHLLSLSPAAKGLFKRVWLMSGTVLTRYYTTTPEYARDMAIKFLTPLGLNDTDPDEVHDQLIKMPIDVINNISTTMLSSAISTFTPVQESVLPGVTRIIEDDPEILLAKGYGDDIPLLVGFVNNEGAPITLILKNINAVEMYKKDATSIVPVPLEYKMPKNATKSVAKKLAERYFSSEPTVDEYANMLTESFFIEPTLRFVRDRMARGGAPLFLYKFSYEADNKLFTQAVNLTYKGVGHLEDMTYIFKTNSISLRRSSEDDSMIQWMTHFVDNFVNTGYPSPNCILSWPPESANQSLQYQEISTPDEYHYNELSDEDRDMLQFYDQLTEMSENSNNS